MGSAAAARRAAAALRRVGSFFRPVSSPIRSAHPLLRPARLLHPPRAGACTSSPSGSGSGRAVVVFVRVIVVGSPPRAHTVARPATPLHRHPATAFLRAATPQHRPATALLRAATTQHRPVTALLRAETPLDRPAPACYLLRPATALDRPAGYLVRARPLHRPATPTSGLAPTGAEDFKKSMDKLHGRLDSIEAENREQNARTAEAIEKVTVQNAGTFEGVQKILAKQAEKPKDWGSVTILGRTLSLPGFVSLAWKCLDTFKG